MAVTSSFGLEDVGSNPAGGANKASMVEWQTHQVQTLALRHGGSSPSTRTNDQVNYVRTI